mgnify:CR=1 FL=1
MSFPARGTWIEIDPDINQLGVIESFPARGTWIEIILRNSSFIRLLSFPARGTWIEMLVTVAIPAALAVVPREGNVD